MVDHTHSTSKTDDSITFINHVGSHIICIMFMSSWSHRVRWYNNIAAPSPSPGRCFLRSGIEVQPSPYS